MRLLCTIERIYKKAKKSNIIDCELGVRPVKLIPHVKLPLRIKKSIFRVVRRFYNYVPSIGEKIVLTFDETAKIFMETGMLECGEVFLSKENLITRRNKFFDVKFTSELGGRILGLTYQNHEFFIPCVHFENEYVVIGGLFESFSPEEHNGLIKEEVKLKDGKLVLEKKGLYFEKKITLKRDQPVFTIDFVIKTKKSREVQFTENIMLTIEGLGDEHLILLPLKDELARARFYRSIMPWFDPYRREYANLGLPGFVYMNDSSRKVLAGFATNDLSFIGIKKGPGMRYFLIQIVFEKRKLKPNEKLKYTVTFGVGELADITHKQVKLTAVDKFGNSVNIVWDKKSDKFRTENARK